MNHLVLIDTITGTVLTPSGCNLVNSDHLLDDEGYGDSDLIMIGKEHGTPISADYNLVQCVADALWGDGADTEWGADTLEAIAEAFRQYRPDLVKEEE